MPKIFKFGYITPKAHHIQNNYFLTWRFHSQITDLPLVHEEVLQKQKLDREHWSSVKA